MKLNELLKKIEKVNKMCEELNTSKKNIHFNIDMHYMTYEIESVKDFKKTLKENNFYKELIDFMLDSELTYDKENDEYNFEGEMILYGYTDEVKFSLYIGTI